jgi:hypothetical protein
MVIEYGTERALIATARQHDEEEVVELECTDCGPFFSDPAWARLGELCDRYLPASAVPAPAQPKPQFTEEEAEFLAGRLRESAARERALPRPLDPHRAKIRKAVEEYLRRRQGLGGDV